MPMEELRPLERIVKSTERVRDLGEVFTPAPMVEEMLDLLPSDIWATNPSPTFLEPACGDGNFLVGVLGRKLNRVKDEFRFGLLPAGTTKEAAQFHALQALSSIYAIDISIENIIGGTPGHEIGARTRLMDTFVTWNKCVLDKSINERSLTFRAAEWIIEHNLIIGNMLTLDSEGKATGRAQIPLIEYIWNCNDLSVSLGKTTLGDVIAEGESDSGMMMSLFPPDEPEVFWNGKALNINEAERIEAPALLGPARNGTMRSV
jgi:hypothetical protein